MKKKKTKYEKASIKSLRKTVGSGINIPGYYVTYAQTKAAEELRKRGYRVSLRTGKVTRK